MTLPMDAQLPPSVDQDSALLRIEDLAVSFPTERRTRRVHAVNGVNLSIYPRQTLDVVGESGCGKSVTALSTLRLVPTPPGRYEQGAIWWSPDGGAPKNLLQISEKQIRAVRGGQIAMIFQEPMTSLNPVYTIGEQIIEAVLLHQSGRAGMNHAGAVEIAVQALTDVGIADPSSRLKEYPHQLSGGMRQRVMIAMALACQPELLLADEPTTALDVTIQAQILELLRKLQTTRDMAVLLITHDLGVVAENADVVAVMYAGRIVEYASVHDIFNRPLHPYTRGLFASMPVIGDQRHRLEAIPGNVPNPADLPTGCPFHPRCSDMHGDPPCRQDVPRLVEVAAQHWVACHHADGYKAGQLTRPDVPYRREAVPAS